MSCVLTYSLLVLLDGLLSRDDGRIHNALVQINEAACSVAPDVNILPKFVGHDTTNKKNNATKIASPTADDTLDESFQTSTSTTVDSNYMRPPSIIWTITKTTRRKRYQTSQKIDRQVGVNDGTNDNLRIDQQQQSYKVDLCHFVNIALDLCPYLASTKSTHDGSIALHFAASVGIVPLASVIYHHLPGAATTPNKKGKIPMHFAAREGRMDMVHFFLSMTPCTASIATKKLKLPLHFAASDGRIEVCRALLELYPRGAAMPSAKGKIPLHLCARWGHVEVAKDLVKEFPDGVRMLDWDGSLPLHDSAREGQLEMSRYLLDLFPLALSTANLRNEIPLFPAVRSGNLDLVALFVQAWPAGCRCILQNVLADDNINAGWMNWNIMELLLRGAVQKLNDCPLLEGKVPPKGRLIMNDGEDWTNVVQPSLPRCVDLQKLKQKVKSNAVDVDIKRLKVVDTRQGDQHYSTQQPPYHETTTPVHAADAGATEISVMDIDFDVDEIESAAAMRSKSPILEQYISSEIEKIHLKRSRSESSSSTVSHNACGRTRDCDRFFVPEENRIFVPLHSAFEGSASSHVLQYVINERLHLDLNKKDERGMLPLHWAVTQCNRPKLDTLQEKESLIGMIKDNLLNPGNGSLEAVKVRDKVFNRLPLHFAILYDADIRIIKDLIAANPPSAVEICQTRDRFCNHTPFQMSMETNCSLNTLYELLRADPVFITRERKV